MSSTLGDYLAVTDNCCTIISGSIMSRWKRTASVFEVATRGLLQDRCPSAAASLAFYGLISGFPLLLLSVTISTLWLEPEQAASQVEEILRQYVPISGSKLIERSLEGAVRAGGATAGLYLIVLLWSGSFVFTELRGALNSAWRMQAERRVWMRFLIDSLLVLLAVIVISLGMLYETFATSLWTSLAGTPDLQQQESGRLAVTLLRIALELVLVLVLFRYLPERRVRWRDALPGAALAIGLFHANQLVFRSYVGHFGGQYIEVYGPLSSLTILLIWAYITALIFLFGVEFSAAWARTSGHHMERGDAPLVEKLEETPR